MDMFPIAGILAVGSLAQVFDGALGMGYGATTSTLLLAAGVLPIMVTSGIHIAKIFTSLSSGLAHLQMGNVRGDIFWPLAVFGSIGGVLGALCLVSLPIGLMRITVSVFLLVLGMAVLYKFLRGGETPSRELVPPRRLTPWALVAGFMDAVAGGGWGPACTPVLMLNGTEPRKVVGSVNLAEFFVAVAVTATVITHIGLGAIPWRIAAPLIAAGIVMAPVAGWASKTMPPRMLGMLMGTAIVTLNSIVLIKMF